MSEYFIGCNNNLLNISIEIINNGVPNNTNNNTIYVTKTIYCIYCYYFRKNNQAFSVM